jgi:hypothetical protein
MLQHKLFLSLIIMAMVASLAADKKATEHFSALAILPANASGSSTVPLSINIQGYTDDSTMSALSDILSDGNNQGALLKKFQDMPGIGDVSREGRVGVQIKVIRVQQTSDGGRQITMLTDRPIHFWEAAQSSPTVDYPYGMLQFTVNDSGDGKGKAYPIVKLKGLTANNIEIDDYGVIPIDLTIHQIK